MRHVILDHLLDRIDISKEEALIDEHIKKLFNVETINIDVYETDSWEGHIFFFINDTLFAQNFNANMEYLYSLDTSKMTFINIPIKKFNYDIFHTILKKKLRCDIGTIYNRTSEYRKYNFGGIRNKKMKWKKLRTIK